MLATILPDSVGFYLGLMMLGFFIGGFGHVIKSKPMIALGVTMIFLATLLLPILLNVFDQPPELPSQFPEDPSGE